MKKDAKKQKPKDEIVVKITKKGYGLKHMGRDITYEGFKDNLKEVEGVGPMPKFVVKDGSFVVGKNILDSLLFVFGKDKFTLKISKTAKESSVLKIKGKANVTLTFADLKKIQEQCLTETADIKNDVVVKQFSKIFPKHYKETTSSFYRAGSLERWIPADGNVALSIGDKERIRKLYSKAIVGGLSTSGGSSEEIAKEKAVFQLSTLEAYADALEKRIKKSTTSTKKDEADWQKYIKEHITNIKEEYIQKFEKLNIGGVDRASFPDFLLLTQDNFIDVLEIKTPNTPLVSYDPNHQNYYLSTEVSKAVAQAEKYIEQVAKKSLEVENYLMKTLKMPLGIVRPQGLVLVGSDASLAKQASPDKARQDFRRLRGAYKDIKIITYTELLVGLRNRIAVLKRLVRPKAVKGKKAKAKRSN